MEHILKLAAGFDWSPFWISLKTGVVATVICFFLGLWAARQVLRLGPKARAVVDGILTLPMVDVYKRQALVGVPGAAAKVATTTFDVLLPQLMTEEKLTRTDLIRLGDGGFCQSCPECHWPNCTFGRY